RLVFVDRPYLFAYRGNKPLRICGAAHDKSHRRSRKLRIWNVHAGRGFFFEGGVPYVSCDSNYRQPGSGRVTSAQPDAYPDGIVVRQEAGRDALVYDRHTRRTLIVLVGKMPAAHKWDAERVEVIGADHSPVGYKAVAFRRWRAAFD